MRKSRANLAVYEDPKGGMSRARAAWFLERSAAVSNTRFRSTWEVARPSPQGSAGPTRRLDGMCQSLKRRNFADTRSKRQPWNRLVRWIKTSRVLFVPHVQKLFALP